MATTYLSGTGFPAPPGIELPAFGTDVEEELREISTELAGSIRREMELEDLVDRLQLEASQGPELGRRTSDYFSDSGSGSYRYAMSDADGKLEDLAKQKRLSEQEKAQFKLSLTQKLQDERSQRKVLEDHIRHLEDRVHNVGNAYRSTLYKANQMDRSIKSAPSLPASPAASRSLKVLWRTIEDDCWRSAGSKRISKIFLPH